MKALRSYTASIGTPWYKDGALVIQSTSSHGGGHTFKLNIPQKSNTCLRVQGPTTTTGSPSWTGLRDKDSIGGTEFPVSISDGFFGTVTTADGIVISWSKGNYVPTPE